MAKAVLLGEREQVEYGRTENFMATGVIHLLVIAGLHIGILAGAVWWLVRRTPLSRGWAVALVSAAALGYMLLVDAGPSVVRRNGPGAGDVRRLVLRPPAALVQFAGRRGADRLGAESDHLFHTGAQLSFLSVAGIMWFAPYWKTTRAIRWSG